MRLLLVEDEAFIAVDLELAVAAAGHEVAGVAVDTRQALEIAARERPDAALVDVNLADGRTGVALCRRLVQEYGLRAAFLTGNPEQVPEDRAGALALMEKPYSPERLSSVLSLLAGA